jgi:diphthine-ammonia ligase
LGLKSLAYLWQRDQAELLAEMIDAGLEAILIKVAGAGLTTKHLGMNLAQMQSTLHKLVRSSP